MEKKTQFVENEQIMNENFYNEIKNAKMRGFSMLFDDEKEENSEETIENCLKRLTNNESCDNMKV